MMGKAQKHQAKLFYHNISLERRLPQDHPLRKITRLVDFTFIRSRVDHLYGKNGNSSVDPAVILKLMFLLFYENVKSERALMETLPLRLDWLWFCGYDLDDQIPDHSVISKARRRWGPDVFADFFATVLQQCIRAGLVDGQTIHIDSSMIAANASMDSLKPQLHGMAQTLYNQLETQSQPVQQAQDEHNGDDDTASDTSPKRISATDPDARAGKKYGTTTLGYKDHRVIDDTCGIITATITTAANVNDSKILITAVETHQNNTDKKVNVVAGDKGYGVIENYKYLRNNGTMACIPHKEHVKNGKFSYKNFCYDATHNCYICPAHQVLEPVTAPRPDGTSEQYRIKRAVCEKCRFLSECVSSNRFGRSLRRNIDIEYIEWADSCLSIGARRRLMTRRKIKVEGSFADAANNHGFKHARWRGFAKMQIQNFMIAGVQNLRKLLRYLDRGRRSATAVIETAGVFQAAPASPKSHEPFFCLSRERILTFLKSLVRKIQFT